jgi:hypothetical protein
VDQIKVGNVLINFSDQGFKHFMCRTFYVELVNIEGRLYPGDLHCCQQVAQYFSQMSRKEIITSSTDTINI